MKYIDRDGKVTIEESGQDRLLKKLYTCRTGRAVLKIMVRPFLSNAAGRLLSQRCSRCLIRPFVKKNKIDMSCFEERNYISYNDFFTRKIKPEFRPIDDDGSALICPCDGKLSVYPIVNGSEGKSMFCIKNTTYTLESLLRSCRLARHFEGGYACVIRLTVDDYHRYCYIDDGKKSGNVRIPGVFHTVNPAANDVMPIYKENTREYTLLKTLHFKTVLMMEVGAMLVGRITNYHGECQVKRGREKGRFEFGGSTIVLIFQKDSVCIDESLIRNTEDGYETIVKMGERIGEAFRP